MIPARASPHPRLPQREHRAVLRTPSATMFDDAMMSSSAGLCPEPTQHCDCDWCSHVATRSLSPAKPANVSGSPPSATRPGQLTR
jgi:hypothetical protein